MCVSVCVCVRKHWVSRAPCTDSCDQTRTGQSRDWWCWTNTIIHRGCDISKIADLFWTLSLGLNHLLGSVLLADWFDSRFTFISVYRLILKHVNHHLGISVSTLSMQTATLRHLNLKQHLFLSILVFCLPQTTHFTPRILLFKTSLHIFKSWNSSFMFFLRKT